MKFNYPHSDKVAVMFTGGVESYLLGKQALLSYGKENVLFVLWLMDSYNVFYHDKEKTVKIKSDFDRLVEKVGGKHKLVIDNDLYKQVEGDVLAIKTLNSIKTYDSTINHILLGFNNIHRECYELSLAIDFKNNKNNASERARLHLSSERHIFSELYEQVFKCDGVIYFIEDDFTVKTYDDIESVANSDYFFSPFIMLRKEDVILKYKELDILDELFKTQSCNTPHHNKHCGQCKNCLTRKIAFKRSGIQDKTEYLC